MDPKLVGWPSNELVLGKLSGRAGLRARLEDLGYHLTKPELDGVFEQFKDLADRKREVTDKDLESLMAGQRRMDTELQLSLIHISEPTRPERIA